MNDRTKPHNQEAETSTRSFQPKKRFAIFWSIILPGLGLFYSGVSLRTAILVCLLQFNFKIIFGFSNFGLEWTQAIPVMFIFITLFWFGIIIASFRIAKKNRGRYDIPERNYKIFVTTAILSFLVSEFIQTRYDTQFFGYKSYHVPTASMEPSVVVGDRIIVDFLAYNRTQPKIGDIIAFRYPRDPTVTYIKRIVAKSGDKFLMTNGRVSLNGKPISYKNIENRDAILRFTIDSHSQRELLMEKLGDTEHPVSLDTRYSNMYLNFPANQVPYQLKTGFFVLGDNRSNASDSRNWGEVSPELVIGKVRGVFFSIDPTSESIRWDRVFHILD